MMGDFDANIKMKECKAKAFLDSRVLLNCKNT